MFSSLLDHFIYYKTQAEMCYKWIQYSLSLKELPFDAKLTEAARKLDWSLRVGRFGALSVACPDAMLHVGDELDREDQAQGEYVGKHDKYVQK